MSAAYQVPIPGFAENIFRVLLQDCLCRSFSPCPISELGEAFTQLSKQEFLAEHALKMARAAYQPVERLLNSE